MQIPLQITWQDVDHKPRDVRDIHTNVEKLERYYDRIVGCHVTVAEPHKNQKSNNPIAVKIVLSVPQSDVVVNHETPGQGKDTLRVAIRDAFEAARRQLRHRADKSRTHVDRHQPTLEKGQIASLFNDQDFGFINTPEGVEVHFNRNALSEANFDGLEVGDVVRFHREDGEDGPRATVVYVD